MLRNFFDLNPERRAMALVRLQEVQIATAAECIGRCGHGFKCNELSSFWRKNLRVSVALDKFEYNF